MDITSLSPTSQPSAESAAPERLSLTGQDGLDAARRRSPEFARMLNESAEQLAPDPRAAADRITRQNLIDQTAAMNILAARWSTAFNPAIIGYASQFANLVNLEGNMPPHRLMRPNVMPGDEEASGFRPVTPVNESQGGTEVL
jgi:hypothetical protein